MVCDYLDLLDPAGHELPKCTLPETFPLVRLQVNYNSPGAEHSLAQRNVLVLVDQIDDPWPYLHLVGSAVLLLLLEAVQATHTLQHDTVRRHNTFWSRHRVTSFAVVETGTPARDGGNYSKITRSSCRPPRV